MLNCCSKSFWGISETYTCIYYRWYQESIIWTLGDTIHIKCAQTLFTSQSQCNMKIVVIILSFEFEVYKWYTYTSTSWKAICLSVRTQTCLHWSKWNLLIMKVVSFRPQIYFYKSAYASIHPHMCAKIQVWAKQPLTTAGFWPTQLNWTQDLEFKSSTRYYYQQSNIELKFSTGDYFQTF